jgi:hypothetical protein
VPPLRDFGSEPVPTSADTVGYAVYEARTRRGEIGVSVSYQFFENVFAHPYLSAGARIEWTDIQKTRMGDGVHLRPIAADLRHRAVEHPAR